jgi:hypothetical protein
MEIVGDLATDPLAGALAAEVQRVHRRYAQEVVSEFALCPFLRDVESGFGRFCVFLDREPSLDRALQVALAGDGVAHLVFPLVPTAPTAFERFGAALGGALRTAADPAPVIATFHPLLSGDSSTPHRLVGMLRRAPDPFVQLVPAGLHQGGTVFAGAVHEQPGVSRAKENFRRLIGADLERLLATLADIHADRERSYAPLLAKLGRTP